MNMSQLYILFKRSIKILFFSLIILEVFSYIILNYLVPEIGMGKRTFESPLFGSIEYGKSITREYYDNSYLIYHPFFIYSLGEYKGKHLNIVGGKRVTCYNSESPDYVIWIFGGSTLFGFFSENDCVTIPSFIAKKLNEKNYNVKVINYGVPGYYSTQEMIKYLWLLKNEEEKPDLVIFYDGINDALFSIFTEKDRVYLEPYSKSSHSNKAYLYADLNNMYIVYYLSLSQPFFSILFESNTYNLAVKIMSLRNVVMVDSMNDSYSIPYSEIKDMSSQVWFSYLYNVEYIRGISFLHNSSVLNFWQPALSRKLKKKFGVWEGKKYPYYQRSLNFYIRVFDDICINKNMKEKEIISLCFLFYNTSDDIFVDRSHTTSKGNEIIADAMLPYIEEKLKSRNP